MAAEPSIENSGAGREAYSGVLRFYDLAKRREWQVRDLPWGEVPPIPEVRPDTSPAKKARRRDLWRSVLSQQLQADMLACDMSSQLLNMAPDPEAKLYYSTMVQDESRHTEAWLRLINEAGGPTDRDPHLDKLVQRVLQADLLEAKVFMMQVFFEQAIIQRFRQIAKAAGGTVLEKLCEKLQADDGIHHGAGMAYERVLLSGAPKKVKQQVAQTASGALSDFVAHVRWRPPERAFVGDLMKSEDERYIREEVEGGIRRGEELGLDFSQVSLPF